MAENSNLAFDFGEDWLITLTCYEADGVTELDLTGASAVFCLGTFETPVLTATGAIGSPATDGVVDFHITPAQQANLRPRPYPWTARVTLESGLVTDQAYGQLTPRET